MILDILQSIGVVCGILGAVLVASSSSTRRRQGFAVWIAGNTAWVVVGVLAHNPYTFVLFGVYLVTAVAGLRANRDLAPALEGRQL